MKGWKSKLRDCVHSHPALLYTLRAAQKARQRVRYLKDYGVSDWWFDQINGLETRGLQKPDTLSVVGPNGSEATWYLPVRPKVLLHVLASLRIEHRNYTFIDIGSGKGRAVLLPPAIPSRRRLGSNSHASWARPRI